MKADIVFRTDHFVATAFYRPDELLDFISITQVSPSNEFIDRLYEDDGAYGFSKWLEKRVDVPITLDPEFRQFFARAQNLEQAQKWMRKASSVLDKSIGQYNLLFML